MEVLSRSLVTEFPFTPPGISSSRQAGQAVLHRLTDRIQPPQLIAILKLLPPNCSLIALTQRALITQYRLLDLVLEFSAVPMMTTSVSLAVDH